MTHTSDINARLYSGKDVARLLIATAAGILTMSKLAVSVWDDKEAADRLIRHSIDDAELLKGMGDHILTGETNIWWETYGAELAAAAKTEEDVFSLAGKVYSLAGKTEAFAVEETMRAATAADNVPDYSSLFPRERFSDLLARAFGRVETSKGSAP